MDTEQIPEPELTNYRGPRERAIELLASAVLYAMGLFVVLTLFVAVFLNPFFWGIRRSEDVKTKAAQTQLRSFHEALLDYTGDHGRPPTAAQGLRALCERPTSAPKPPNWRLYLDIPEVPMDPWGNEYQYASPGPDGERWFIRSFGKDGAPDGEGHDADLVVYNHDEAPVR